MNTETESGIPKYKKETKSGYSKYTVDDLYNKYVPVSTAENLFFQATLTRRGRLGTGLRRGKKLNNPNPSLHTFNNS